MEELVARLGRWSSGRGPLYLLLAVRLRALIDDGLLPPGTPLPPERTLARRLAVARGTVVAAYDRLAQEGKVTRRQGSGTRVSPGELPAVRSAADGVTNPLLLHILDPPDGVALLSCAAPDAPPPELIEAYLRAVPMLAAVDHDIGYHPAGHPMLRQALAAYYRDRGLPTESGQILVTNGGQQAISLVTRLLVAPGDTVLTEAPTYPGALEIFRDAAALFATATDVDGMVAALAARPALAYAIPTARNPTGSVLGRLDRRRLAEAAMAADVPLIDDEAVAELCLSGETPPPLAYFTPTPHEQIITVGSLSKLVWGGLRIGWIRASAPLVSRLARLRAVHDLGGDTLNQLAATHLLSDLDQVRRARVKLLRSRHDHLLSELRTHLPEWHVQPALGGQTVWVRLPRGNADAFTQVAIRHKVAVPPGPAFDPSGGHTDHLRLHFLYTEQELTTAVTRLATAWTDYDRDHPGNGRETSLRGLIL